MKLPLTFNSLFWLANARGRLAFWLREQRKAARRWAALNKPMPADIAGQFAASVGYWRGEIAEAREWLIDALNGLDCRLGFGT